jgi:quercetin dioxygenase-like cupin family protein
MTRVCLILVSVALVLGSAKAQDPVKVDPAHYKVESENAKVRVLRIHYGPHEKSPMHEHPDAVVTFLTDGHTRFTLPDGKTEDATFKAGETRWTPAGKHAPENLSDQPFDLVLVELKGSAPSNPANLQGSVR